MSQPREVRRRELGAFLRAYRERMRPTQLGLKDTPRRRTPGLRREEVAGTAGVGVTWYTWLEQGRVTPSRQVLGAVARVLQLSEDEVAHVMALAGLQPPELPDRSGQIAARLQSLLTTWTVSPAVLVDRHLDLIAWNAAYACLWSDPAAVPAHKRNLVCMLLESEALAVKPPDRSSLVWDLTRQLRTHASRSPDPRFNEVFALLQRKHPELAAWWGCSSVGEFTTRNVRVGEADFAVSLLRPTEAPDCALLVQTPVPALQPAKPACPAPSDLQPAG